MIDIAGELPTPMDHQGLKDYFTRAINPTFQRRRKIIALSVLGMADATLMVLRQSGIIQKLPDVPLRIFDANTVTTSTKAYDLGLPDSALSTLAYGMTFTLASWGGDQTLYRKKWIDRALFGVCAANAMAGGQYLLNMIIKQKKICAYCITAASVNVIIAGLAWKELGETNGVAD
jgi:uncharacterized membrane protein